MKTSQNKRFYINAVLSSILINLIVGLCLFYLVFYFLGKCNEIVYIVNQRSNATNAEISTWTIFGDLIESENLILSTLISFITIIPILLLIFNFNQLRFHRHSNTRLRTKQQYIGFLLITFNISLFIIFHLMEAIFSAIEIYNILARSHSYWLKNQYPIIEQFSVDNLFLYTDILFFVIIGVLLLTMVMWMRYYKNSLTVGIG